MPALAGKNLETENNPKKVTPNIPINKENPEKERDLFTVKAFSSKKGNIITATTPKPPKISCIIPILVSLPLIWLPGNNPEKKPSPSPYIIIIQLACIMFLPYLAKTILKPMANNENNNPRIIHQIDTALPTGLADEPSILIVCLS